MHIFIDSFSIGLTLWAERYKIPAQPQALPLAAIFTMSIKPFIISLTFLTIVGQISNAQTKYSKVSVDRQMKDTFSFAKQWDYSWEVFKDDSTGEFTRNDDQSLTPADTAHLFYTANCFTNIQGGYDIRYCFADHNKGIITLTFSDGLPAYASEFYSLCQGRQFLF